MIRLSLLLCIVLCSLSSALKAEERGVPFFRNFTAKEYKAHNRNYDIASDGQGTIFVANFEGLLYYDGATWRKIHTPGISRVTRLAKGENGRIWVGGYNVFGYLQPDELGRIRLKTIVSDTQQGALSEVDFIKVTPQKVYVHTAAGKSYFVKGNKLEKMPDDNGIFQEAKDSVNNLKLPLGLGATYSHTSGVNFSNSKFPFAPLSEDNGLISNAINFITYNKSSMIWGATDHGLFAIEAVCPFGQIRDVDGLKGEVNCINQLSGHYYFGTMKGLYRLQGEKLHMVSNIDLACWQLYKISDSKMLAATSAGLYSITPTSVQRITEANTFSVCTDPTRAGYIIGEVDGLYFLSTSGKKTMISPLEKVTHLTFSRGTIRAESIYGEVWEFSLKGDANSISSTERCIRQAADAKAPKLSYTDPFGTLWQTDPEGRNIFSPSNTKYAKALTPWIHPFTKKALNCLYVSQDGKVWAGGDFGVIVLDTKLAKDMKFREFTKPYIRQIVAMRDSVIWGGYSPEDMTPRSDIKDIKLPSSCRHLLVTFSAPLASVVCPTEYRYRINGGKWSPWSTETDVEFNNLSYGSSSIEIQARDLFGRESAISSLEWSVATPLYLKWWAFIIYFIILIIVVQNFLRWRTKRLEAEKVKLEAIVAERTSELEESNLQLTSVNSQLTSVNSQLSDTLDDLKRTQEDLVRMERTATAGKLTQGLIDRILNPINYINNFSKLTSGLAKDLMEDIEDEKDNMSEDNYEDCADIIDMMNQNLTKIEEHGVSTTRTLRAMEAMLNSHIGSLTEHNLASLCHQIVEVTSEYHKASIAEYGIALKFVSPVKDMPVSIDAESMKTAIIALLNNSIYSVLKKAKQSAGYNPATATSSPATATSNPATAGYKPEITLTILPESKGFSVHDNGMGIEETIIHKVFDPFFTTKPTGEAAGVGLYLARNIINDHHGKITVQSQKDHYCLFTVTLE